MYRFLLTPKWLLGHLLVLAVLVTFPQLGLWQLDRRAEVAERNAAIEAQFAAEPRTLAEALAEGPTAYAPVTASGTYRPAQQILTAPASRNGRPPGHQVLTPLETDEGTLLVDRGWVPFDRDGVDEALLDPPGGTVRVEGMLMPPEQGDPGDGEFIGVIDPAVVAERLGIDLLGMHLLLRDAEPASEGPVPGEAPLLESGNHLSYAVQWFLFTAIVALGYPILVLRTARERGQPQAPATGAEERPGVPAGR